MSEIIVKLDAPGWANSLNENKPQGQKYENFSKNWSKFFLSV